MDIDWVAVYAAGLATVLALARLIELIRKKGKVREWKTSEIFENLLGSLLALETGVIGGNPSGAWISFLQSFYQLKDRILGLKPTLDKEAPQISSKLSKLIYLLEVQTGGTWTVRTSNDMFVSDPEVRNLVSEIRKAIVKWSSERA